MEEIVTTDRLDRQLIQALRINGRAPFRRIADVLGSSEQTVARRYRRLHEAGVIRVVALPNPRAFAEQWYIRVRVQPQAAVALAEAVARRPDVSWVGLMSGGVEVTFTSQARTAAERDALLLDRLPRSKQVVDVDAVVLLRRFGDALASGWAGLADPLTPDQVAALGGRAQPDVARADADALDTADPALLAALGRDGRLSHVALAQELGDTPGRVGKQVEALLAGRAMVVDVEVTLPRLGFATSALLWIRVLPEALEEIGHRLAAEPEVSFAAATSGATNLIAHVATHDIEHLYAFLQERVAPLSAIRDVQVSPVLRLFKLARTVAEHGRLPTTG